MKKNILCASLLFGLVLTQTACMSDGKDEYLDDYKTIVYFLNSGEQDVTLYKTGETTHYSVVVDKGGSDAASSTVVNITPLDQSQISIYNNENETDFTALPASCYTINGSLNMELASKDMYKTLDVEFKTDQIYALADANYVLALSCTSNDSVNSKKNIVLLKPNVVIPSLGFSEAGLVSGATVEYGSASSAKMKLQLSMPLDCLWDFDCTLKVDKDLLDTYNEENGTDYQFLDLGTDSYTVSFKNGGTSTPSVDVNVDLTSLEPGEYVLPVEITSCGMESFTISEQSKTCLLKLTYQLPSIALTADMLSSNWEPDEGSLAELLDGNFNTYFHSTYSYDIGALHCIEVALKDEISAFTFYYANRNSNGNAAMTDLIVSGSTDGVNFTDIREFTTAADKLPSSGTNSGEDCDYTSPMLQTSSPVKYLRFTCKESKGNNGMGYFFVWSEFKLFGR